MISFRKLKVFQLYCDNRVNYKEFEEMMLVIYPHTKGDGYIEALWPQFTNHPVQFMTSRNETGLFTQINNRIHMEGYNG